jgi:hypothetical protein
MKEYTKKQLDRIIKESMSDVDEMAYRSGKKNKFQKPWVQPRKISPKFKDDNPTPERGFGQADYWIINLTLETGRDTSEFPSDVFVAMPLGCSELEEFVEKNKDFIKEIESEWGLPIHFPECRNPYYEKDMGDFYKVERKYEGPYSPSERIQRDIHPIIAEILEDEQTKKTLELLSLPPIVVKDKKHRDRYGENTPTQVEYSTHTVQTYDTQQSLFDAAAAKVLDENLPDDVKSKIKTFYLRRQNNKIYSRYGIDKPNQKTPQATITPRYQLPKYDLRPEEIEVTTKSTLDIKGNLDNDTFVWTVTYISKFGKKTADEYTIKDGGFKIFNDIVVIKNVPVRGIKFTDDNPITRYKPALDALRDALIELDKKFEELSPFQTLDRANMRLYDVSKSELRESKVQKIIIEAINKKINKPLRK